MKQVKHRLYNVWASFRARCNNPSAPQAQCQITSSPYLHPQVVIVHNLLNPHPITKGEGVNMSEMIQRVARACELAVSDLDLRKSEIAWADVARAAIEALREPTDAQIISALTWALEWMSAHKVDGLSPFKDYPPINETTAGMWRAMINSALK